MRRNSIDRSELMQEEIINRPVPKLAHTILSSLRTFLLRKKAALGGFSPQAKNAGYRNFFAKTAKKYLSPCRSKELVRKLLKKNEV